MNEQRRVAVITGAAGGLGSSVARLLAAKNHDLALVDINEEGLCALAAHLNVEGVRAEPILADLCITSECLRVISQAIRSFGKSAFLKLTDRTGTFQVFVRKDDLSENDFVLFKTMDVGDIAYFAGKLFRTKTNELTLEAKELKLVTKGVRPLPEKWHGLTDVEARYRHRYVDLIINPQVKETFVVQRLRVGAVHLEGFFYGG